MAANMTIDGGGPWGRLRWWVWGGAAMLLLVPLVAMRFTAEVAWTPFDFAVMGTLLGLACAAFEAGARAARSYVHVAAVGVAVAAAFLLTWANLAVGIVGREGGPANLMFFGVPAIGLVVSALARLKPPGMARAMAVVAMAQAGASVVALIVGGGRAAGVAAVFAAMWLVSAWLFRRAARHPAEAGEAP